MIEIKHLRKEYESVTPIKDITVTINDGDVISIVGPSGTGKSTLLRMINLLEKPTSGEIFIDGKDVIKEGLSSSDVGGKIVMVFQSFNLFNHLTVLENVTFAPIKLKHANPKKTYDRAMQLLSDVGLAGFAFSYPSQLSGGQKQRAAIARAIAMDPEVLLFDEPTSALDPTMTGEIELVIKHLASKGYTMLLVTHNMDFAESVANRVFYLDEGGVYEDGTPSQIFHHPKREKTKAFVKQLKTFSGDINPALFDHMDLYTKLNAYIYQSEFTKDLEKRTKAIFEELCVQMVTSLYDDNSFAKFEVSYSQNSKKVHVTLTYKNLDLDLDNKDFVLSSKIIKHYANEIRNKELSDGYKQMTIVLK